MKKERKQTSFTKTLHFKVKPHYYDWLNEAARETNYVWNYCRGIPDEYLRTDFYNKYFEYRERKIYSFKSGYSYGYGLKGMSKILNHVGQGSVIEIGCQYVTKRKAYISKLFKAKKYNKLFTVRDGLRAHLRPRFDDKALGWVPFRSQEIKKFGTAIKYGRKTFRLFNGKELLQYGKIQAGSFSQDAVGDWYLNVTVNVPPTTAVRRTGKVIGIDLGLKAFVTTSDGKVTSIRRFYRENENKIAAIQSHLPHIERKKGAKISENVRKRTARIHRKIARQRADAQHKLSRKLVDEYDVIYVGDVSSTKLARTRMAKSVYDAAWGQFKTFLQYKGNYAGKKVEVVNEALTTQACSNCGHIGGPKGLRHLGMRHWRCETCGVSHNRDKNAAKNILDVGLGQFTICRSNASAPVVNSTGNRISASVGRKSVVKTGVLARAPGRTTAIRRSTKAVATSVQPNGDRQCFPRKQRRARFRVATSVQPNGDRQVATSVQPNGDRQWRREKDAAERRVTEYAKYFRTQSKCATIIKT